MRFDNPVLPTLLILLAATRAFAGDPAPAAGNPLAAAEAAYQAKEYSRVLEIVEPALGTEKDLATLVRLRYLAGKSLFEMTATDVKACREAGTLKKYDVNASHADAMKKAGDHFKAVYDLDPASPLAPESLFMTGQILDIGCLNHFKEAIAQYDVCRQKYPADPYGKMAEDRYQKLKPRMERGGHAHGGASGN